MKWIMLVFALAGCNRGLPVDVPDVAPANVDASPVPDLVIVPAADLATDLPCIDGTPSECAYAYGTEGCEPGYCRGHKWMPDLWSAGCAEGGDLCP